MINIFCPTFSFLDLEYLRRFCLNLRRRQEQKMVVKAELRIQSVLLQKSDWSGRSTFVLRRPTAVHIVKFWQSSSSSCDRSFQQIQAYSSSSTVPLSSFSLALHYRSFSSIRFQYDICYYSTRRLLHCSRTSVGPFQKEPKVTPQWIKVGYSTPLTEPNPS